MTHLLDTHVFLWWYLDRPELPARYLYTLDQAEKDREPLGLSVFSLWEIAKLVSLGRFKIDLVLDQWMEEVEGDPLLKIIPLSGKIVLESTRLGPQFPKDPADQLIAATARCHGLRLMTVDERIVSSGTVAIA